MSVRHWFTRTFSVILNMPPSCLFPVPCSYPKWPWYYDDDDCDADGDGDGDTAVEGGTFKEKYKGFSTDNPCGGRFDEMQALNVTAEPHECRPVR